MRSAPVATNASAEADSGASSGVRSVPTHRPLSVLVVEDDEASRVGLGRAVEILGYECRCARDGQEAWQMHQARPADVILSDWNMPGMDGIELCRRTRDSAKVGAYTYFVLVTAMGDKEHFLRGMDAGADDYFAKPIDVDELQARLVSAGRVIALNRQLATSNDHLRRDSQRSFRLARVDPLTDVSNRLRMNEDLGVLWSRVTRYAHRYSLAMCDIDEFKKYNDTFGHVAGDAVLRRVAQAIQGQLRQGDALYRYGGEEFVVVLPEQPLAEAAHAMDRVRREIERLAIPQTTGGVLTICIGVAEADPMRDGSVRGWIERADAALYRAKAAGRNRVEAHETARATR